MKNLKQEEIKNMYEEDLASGATMAIRATGMANYMNQKAKAGVATKLTAYFQSKADREAEIGRNRPHTYGEIIKTAKKAKVDIEKLTGEPDRLVQVKRSELNKEFDDLKEAELFSEDGRALWVAGKIEKYLQSEEYLAVKNDLKEATNLYAECLALKEQWEQDNADIIEAERVRSKREELLSADPETLRGLGITPIAGTSKKSEAGSKGAVDENAEMEKALRSIHPFATDAEIKAML